MPKMYNGNPAVTERRDGRWEIKLLVSGGTISTEQMNRVSEVASRYGREVHFTMRQEVAILGIEEKDLDAALAELEEVGLVPGSSGMTVRNVTACLGDKYCFKATQETTSIAKQLEKEFTGMKTPGPVKIGISACPYPCTRPQFNEIGLMGRVRPDLDMDTCTGCGKCVAVCKPGATSLVDGKAVIDYDKCLFCGRCVVACPEDARFKAEDGFLMFVGGRGSWPPHEGWILREFITRDEIVPQVRRIIDFYKEKAEPKTRMREFIRSVGFDEFKERVLNGISQ
ncbi:MAG: 4Fe-4S dicluster domain-containing protein [Methanomassiliicoccales archaeon]